MALAGGVTGRASRTPAATSSDDGILSADGHCRAFDARAGGTVGGNGVGVVVLKRLADALADGDTIHAVIRGSAVNNDGAGKVGFTAPSVDGQAAVIRAAHAAGRRRPAPAIGYVEAHGTGTPLGDPIEVRGADPGVRAEHRPTRLCALGSVKTNIGHLDAAAGVAGLIKTVLGADARRASRRACTSRAPNPELDFADSPFYVNARAARLAAHGSAAPGRGQLVRHRRHQRARGPRGGAACPAARTAGRAAPAAAAVRPQPGAALDAARRRLAGTSAGAGADLADVACTLQAGRRAFAHRRVRGRRRSRRRGAARWPRSRRPHGDRRRRRGPRRRRVPVPRPGRAARRHGRGALPSRSRCSGPPSTSAPRLLRRHLGTGPARRALPGRTRLPRGRRRAARADARSPSRRCSPSSTRWPGCGRSGACTPDAMLGHSIGEYVAACLAGVFEPARTRCAWCAAARRADAETCRPGRCSRSRCPRPARRPAGPGPVARRGQRAGPAWWPVSPPSVVDAASPAGGRGSEGPTSAHQRRRPLDPGRVGRRRLRTTGRAGAPAAPDDPVDLRPNRVADRRGRGLQPRLLASAPAAHGPLLRRA